MKRAIKIFAIMLIAHCSVTNLSAQCNWAIEDLIQIEFNGPVDIDGMQYVVYDAVICCHCTASALSELRS